MDVNWEGRERERERERQKERGKKNVPSEIHLGATGFHAPARPEGFALVEWCSGANVLTGQCVYGCGDGSMLRIFPTCFSYAYRVYFLRLLLAQANMPALPPIQLCNLGHSALLEPHLVPQRREEVRFRELALQPLDGRVAEVVIVVVANHHCVYNR